ncbi:MAG: TonB-dependent siderophore receptor [Leptolyngbyaceae bacterium]|nr:TonB-dependent siderophore receptor [Leptolyngbyaceae bacterium]
MSNQLQRSLFVLGVLSSAIASPAMAEGTLVSAASEATAIPRVSDRARPITTINEWISQQIAPIQITQVRLTSSPTGVGIVLETAGASLPTSSTSTVGNTLIIEIPNAVLALPDPTGFQAANPTEGISQLSVTQISGERVQVAITGVDALPTANIGAEGQSLVVNVAPGSVVAESTEADAIDLVVTGQQDARYSPSRASTATRTDTPLRDTPRTIQVIPEQVLKDQAITRVGDAIQNVSGVVQDGGFGSTSDQLNIRGFFTDGIFVDGFRGAAGRGFAETANLERIEVLRGPASILFGNTEPSGIINLVTKQPLENPFQETELRVGNYGFFRPTIDLTGPLTEDRTILYRLNAAYEHFDGFRNFNQNVDRIFVAPSLALRFGDATTLNLDFTYRRDERPFDRGLVASGRGVADIPISRILGEPGDFNLVKEYGAGFRLEHTFSEQWKVRNQLRILSTDSIDYRAEPLALNAATGILTRNFRSNDDLAETYSLQTDVLGNFLTGSVGHNLLIGLDLRRQTSGGTQRRLPGGLTPSLNIFNPVYNAIPRPGLDELTQVVRNNLDRTDALGILVQDQIKFSDNLILALGGRFDVVSQNNLNKRNGQETIREDTAFTPSVGVVYKPIEPISLYANFAQSFQPNFGTGEDGNFLEPERGTQYEVGVQAEISDRLTLSLAAYNITKTNLATSDPTGTFSIPIAEQRSQGIDLNIAGEILPGWNVIASYGYIDAAYTQEYFGLLPGSRVQNVPRNTASLWTTYEIQRGDLQGLGFGAGVFHVGERAGDFSDTFDLPGYWRTDATVFYRRDHWKAAINVQNLFDVRYFKANNFGRVAIEPGAPMTIVGSLSVEF